MNQLSKTDFKSDINKKLLYYNKMPKFKKRKGVTSESDVEIFEFGSSTSHFKDKEKKALKINIINTDDFDNIISQNDVSVDESDITEKLKELYLPDIDKDRIKTMKFKEIQEFSENVASFIFKLKLVIENNYSFVDVPRFEDYIHDMVIELLKMAELEKNSEGLFMMPCNLRLEIGEESFAAQADREGRRGSEIVWILDEDKHVKNPNVKHSDIQLIACMIAAAQRNRYVTDDNYPEKIIGCKFIGDYVNFYSMKVDNGYLDQLVSGLPNKSIEVYKFPVNNMLSLSKPEDRKKVFWYLTSLKKYAKKITPVYKD